MNRETTDERLVYARNTKSAFLLFVNLSSIRHVTGTHYSVNISEVWVCRSSVVSKKMSDVTSRSGISSPDELLYSLL